MVNQNTIEALTDALAYLNTTVASDADDVEARKTRDALVFALQDETGDLVATDHDAIRNDALAVCQLVVESADLSASPSGRGHHEKFVEATEKARDVLQRVTPTERPRRSILDVERKIEPDDVPRYSCANCGKPAFYQEPNGPDLCASCEEMLASPQATGDEIEPDPGQNPWADVWRDAHKGEHPIDQAIADLEAQSARQMPVETCGGCGKPAYFRPGIGAYQCATCKAIRTYRGIWA